MKDLGPLSPVGSEPSWLMMSTELPTRVLNSQLAGRETLPGAQAQSVHFSCERREQEVFCDQEDDDSEDLRTGKALLRC